MAHSCAEWELLERLSTAILDDVPKEEEVEEEVEEVEDRLESLYRRAVANSSSEVVDAAEEEEEEA